jgi:hypothetical protein
MSDRSVCVGGDPIALGTVSGDHERRVPACSAMPARFLVRRSFEIK